MKHYNLPRYIHILGIIFPTEYIIFFRGAETTNQLWFIVTWTKKQVKAMGFNHSIPIGKHGDWMIFWLGIEITFFTRLTRIQFIIRVYVYTHVYYVYIDVYAQIWMGLYGNKLLPLEYSLGERGNAAVQPPLVHWDQVNRLWTSRRRSVARITLHCRWFLILFVAKLHIVGCLSQV